MTIERNDLEIEDNLRTILSFSRELNKDFRELDIDSLWKACSAIHVASGEIVRRIVKAIP